MADEPKTIITPGDPNFVEKEEGTPPEPPQPPKSEDTKDIITIDDKEYILNENGDAVNEDGSVFKTKAELETKSTEKEDDSEKVEIDEVEYTIDKDGNAVDENGQIKFTKEELDKMEEASEEDEGSLSLEEIKKKVNIVTVGDDGKELSYDNTENGLVAYINDVRKQTRREAKEAGVSEFLDQYPQVKDVVNYLKINNGNLEGFNSTKSFKDTKIDKDNEEQQISIVAEREKMLGKSEADANEYATVIRDAGKLEEESKKALKDLQKREEEVSAEQERLVKEREQEYNQQIQQYWGVDVKDGKLVDLNIKDSLYNKVKSGKLEIGDKVYSIPENIRVKEQDGSSKTYTRGEFFHYMYVPLEVPLNNGDVRYMTGYEIDMAQKEATRKVDEDVFDALKMFVRYDTSQFIEEQVNKDKVNKIRKLKYKSNSKGTGATNKDKKGNIAYPVS